MRQAKLGKPSNHSGIKHTSEAIEKIRKTRTGQPTWNKGIKMPESFCETMSKIQRGKLIPYSQREKISKSLSGKPHSYEHNLKVHEANIGGFYVGNVRYDLPPRYCEVWKDVNPRVHKFFDYKCVECGAPEVEHSHIGHHVFYVKESCCWYNEDGEYYTNLNCKKHPAPDYYIGKNPNYFVILCSTCHGKTNGNFDNRRKWADHFKDLIDTKYGGKCYTEKEDTG
jgi:hypothetical protein